jgi:transposase
LARFRNGGYSGLDARKRGGRKPKLDGAAIRWVYRTVTEKNPLQLKFTFALWTARMVGQLIQQRFGLKMSKASVCRLLSQLGLSPQRPVWRAYQQRPEEVQRWLQQEYPQIRRLAQKHKALIFFGDEAGVRSDHHAGTTWAQVGQTPVVKATGARYGLNMLSAVNALGHFRFMTVEGRVNASVFRDFLKRLITGMERKIFLIVDGHPAHKARLVSRFVEDNADAIELFFLPPYAPELNPDELAWAHIKTRIAKATTQTKDDLKAMVERVMHRLQKMPEIVAGFFHAPTCAYAKV